MWPLMAKLATEAKDNPDPWKMRGVRTIIMYHPMNALVSDQVSRLRRLIGDPEGKFLNVFRSTCGETVRRPQFGMYTGRTPYPGNEPVTSEDRKPEKTLARMSFPQTDSEKSFFEALRHEGKIPAKVKAFLRKFKARTLDTLPDAIQHAFQNVSSSSCSGWFRSCGYAL